MVQVLPSSLSQQGLSWTGAWSMANNQLCGSSLMLRGE